MSFYSYFSNIHCGRVPHNLLYLGLVTRTTLPMQFNQSPRFSAQLAHAANACKYIPAPTTRVLRSWDRKYWRGAASCPSHHESDAE